MAATEIKKILTAAGVKPYAITECVGGELSVRCEDLRETSATLAAMKSMEGSWDQSDKGFVFFPK